LGFLIIPNAGGGTDTQEAKEKMSRRTAEGELFGKMREVSITGAV
jgi:hypothetical protein